MENNPAPYLDDVIAAQPDGHNRFSFKKKKQRQPSPKEDEGYHGDPNYNFNKDTLRDKNFSVQPEKPSLEKLFDFTPKAGSKMEELQDQTSNYYRSLINMISQTYQKMQNAPIVDSVKQKFGMSQSSMGTAGHHTVTFKDQQDEKDKKGTQLRARPSQQHKHQEDQKHHLGKIKKRMPFLSRLNIRQYWQKGRAAFKKYRGYFWTMFTSMWKFMGVLLSYAYQDVKGFIFGKKPVKNVFLSGNFAPVHDEITADDLPVHGKIRKDIDGYYIRNGPNPQFKPTGPYFWFDGDGMLHSVHLHNGKASYRNRFVKTIRWEDEHHMERSLYSKLGDFSHPLGMAKFLNHQLMSALGMQKYRGKGTANMSVKFFQGKLFALHDLDSPYQVNPATLETIGKYDFDHTLCSVSSSAKVDPKSGDLVFFNYNLFKAPYMTYNVVSSEGKLVEQIPIQMDMPVISHDFGITENYAIFLDLPLTVRPSRLLRGEQMIMFEPNRKARFGVLARHPHSQKAGQKAVQKDSHEQHEDEDRIQWFEAEKPFYMFHLANAWEEKNQIVIIGCASERVPGGLFGSIDHHQQQKQQKQKHSQKKDKKQQEQQHQKKDKKQRAQEHEGEDQKSKKQQRAYSSGEEDEEQKGEKKKGKKHQKPYVLEEIDEGGQHQQQQQQQHQQGEQKDYYHENDQNVQLLKKGEVLSRQFEQRHLPSLWEWRLDLATGHVSQKPLGHLPSDFPLVLPDSMGRPSRFVWSAALARPDVKHPSPLSNGIIKYDIQKGEVAAQMHLGAGKYGGQWEFIPKHSSKDQENGYLGGFVYDERSGQSEFWLVDAKNLDPAPVARVALPRRVPFGFRGTWISAEEMK